MKIISLEASNVKRLQAVEIRPDGNIVIVGGKNGAGKTSVLDSIAAALGGKKLCPRVPIRKGQESAEVRVELDDLVVIRRWTQSGSYLAVETKDGAQHKSPQAILDALVGRLTFDPLAFLRQKPNEQTVTVQELVGLDFAELDAKRQAAYEERTGVNRSLKAAEAQREGLAHHDGVPADPVSVTLLMRELEERRAANRANEDRRRGIARQRMESRQEVEAAKDAEASVAKASEELQRAQEDLVTKTRAALEQAERQLAAANEDAVVNMRAAKEATDGAAAACAAGEAELGAETEKLVDQPTEDLVAEIEGAEGVNAKIAENKRCDECDRTVAELQESSQRYTAEIAKCDDERMTALEAATFPVDGLGLGDEEVTYKDLPLSQASSAEQLRISVAMGISLNPKLRVLLIRDGSLLDQDSLAMLQATADEANVQLWIERVGSDGASVVIEDGAIAGADTEASE